MKERKNTGCGFFTYLEVQSSDDNIQSHVISNVFAQIDGMANPVTFVLFIRGGKMRALEGASVDESTVDIDFTNVQFQIVEK